MAPLRSKLHLVADESDSCKDRVSDSIAAADVSEGKVFKMTNTEQKQL